MIKVDKEAREKVGDNNNLEKLNDMKCAFSTSVLEQNALDES